MVPGSWPRSRNQKEEGLKICPPPPGKIFFGKENSRKDPNHYHTIRKDRSGVASQTPRVPGGAASPIRWSGLFLAVHAFEHLCTFLCKNGKNLIFHSLNDNDSMGCVSGSGSIAARRLHQKGALTMFQQVSKGAPVDG